MATPKNTYFLAPPFDIPPDSPLVLGSIILSPLSPTSTLIHLLPLFHQRHTTAPKPHSLCSGRTPLQCLLESGLHSSLSSVLGLMQVAPAPIHLERSTHLTLWRQRSFGPTQGDDEYLQSRMKDARVQIVLSCGSKRKAQSAYMITGVNIVRGFALSKETIKKRGVKGKLGLSAAAAGVPTEGSPEAKV